MVSTDSIRWMYRLGKCNADSRRGLESNGQCTHILSWFTQSHRATSCPWYPLSFSLSSIKDLSLQVFLGLDLVVHHGMKNLWYKLPPKSFRIRKPLTMSQSLGNPSGHWEPCTSLLERKNLTMWAKSLALQFKAPKSHPTRQSLSINFLLEQFGVRFKFLVAGKFQLKWGECWGERRVEHETHPIFNENTYLCNRRWLTLINGKRA